MANIAETGTIGTIVEVAEYGTSVYNSFVCNEGAIDIDWGTQDENTFTCLATGEERTVLGANKYKEQTFEYVWTQALTNAADTTIRNAKIATNIEDKKVNFRVTMNNKTGAETSGTIYVIPFIVKGYVHKGEKGGVWKTEATIKQIGIPVETSAA
ncbi:MAG: hypothetical protein IE881_07295 [Epsilonproteobacteria bacterium]|nr:hypothetical protein [Campylobacterota bacterium]